ncbi:MAG: bifunctional 5,10-methylenetetrahydrofolate dehydrogenase/5,10-methenyltetrahydrofolate cyclohydrolase [Candidatus Pacebacteria bacterium]|nr:bifunctional 5,10-methylenetetrahydrofolate dehydrogenase/5,10-methenyltetrahydrofolate cyclohydrolase [Candidatus Paceibacterota bacterium]
MIIEGKKIAEGIVAGLKKNKPIEKGITAILTMEDMVSESFLLEKRKIAEQLDIKFELVRLSDFSEEKEILAKIEDLNKDKNCGGIILQLPVAEKFNKDNLISKIDEKKDIDCLKGGKLVLPPAVETLKSILKFYKFNLKDKKISVVGLGFLVGGPISKFLIDEIGKENVSLFDESNFNKEKLAESDLIISGTGSPRLINGEFIKKGVFLVDFGYSYPDGKVSGDFDFDSCELKSGCITPTPGGTGPILIAELFSNFYKLNS